MKVHLLDSAEPLKEGSDFVALCGKLIPKALFAMVWNEKALGEIAHLSSVTHCQKCCQVGEDYSAYPRYWYGLVPGQESEEA